jgi:hypothetical protein
MAFFAALDFGLSLVAGSGGVAPADAAAVVSVRHVFADDVLWAISVFHVFADDELWAISVFHVFADAELWTILLP